MSIEGLRSWPCFRLIPFIVFAIFRTDTEGAQMNKHWRRHFDGKQLNSNFAAAPYFRRCRKRYGYTSALFNFSNCINWKLTDVMHNMWKGINHGACRIHDMSKMIKLRLIMSINRRYQGYPTMQCSGNLHSNSKSNLLPIPLCSSLVNMSSVC